MGQELLGPPDAPGRFWGVMDQPTFRQCNPGRFRLRMVRRTGVLNRNDLQRGIRDILARQAKMSSEYSVGEEEPMATSEGQESVEPGGGERPDRSAADYQRSHMGRLKRASARYPLDLAAGTWTRG